MTLITEQPIKVARKAVEKSQPTSTTYAAPVVEVKTKLIWCSLSTQAEMEINSVLSSVESGQSVSRSPEYTALAMDALLASRNSKPSSKKLAKKLAKDSSKGID